MNRLSLKITAIFIVLVSCLSASAYDRTASERWRQWRTAQDRYPLACWAYFQRFPGTYDEYKLYADCNFTMVSVPTDIDQYNNAVKAGLKVLIGGWHDLYKNPDALEKLLSFPSPDDPNVIGYQMKDEPEPTLFAGLARAYKTIYERDKRNVLPITDLLPDYAWMAHTRRAERFEMNYDEMVSDFIHTVKPPVILNCHYAPMLDGTDRPSFYANNELMRKNALENNIGFMAFVSAVAYSDIYRIPSESDFRWQVSSYLAYGAQGIWYWNWRIKPTDTFKEGLVTFADDRPTDSYYHIQKINAELLRVGNVLMKLRSRNLWHTGDNIPAGTTKFPNMPESGASVIERFVGDDFIVSEFDNQDDPQDKDTYVMLVNKRHGPGLASDDPSLLAEAIFKPAGYYGCIYLYDDKSGKPLRIEPRIYEGKNGYYRLPLTGGQFRLLRFSRSIPDAASQAPKNRIRVEFARQVPAVDADCHDSVWQKSKGLTLLVPGSGDGEPLEPAEAKIAWRDDQLWVSLAMKDSDIIAHGDKNGQEHYRLGDCCEIFLKPEFADWYWEIWINPRGNYTTLFWNKRGQRGSEVNKPYTFELTAAAAIGGTLNDSTDTDSGWRLEVEIPFDGLLQDGKLVKSGQWTILIARQNFTGQVDKDHRELSSFPRLSKPNFHLSEEYDVLNLALY